MAEHPKVAIVGRPNVGKSTLFNRLSGRRVALVSDMPGLTRDRREEVCELLGVPVAVIDTAGLEDAAKGSIPARMREQSEQAVADADLILFVIDAREGITPVDERFAALVRRAGRPTILVANKCEGRHGLDGFYEAFALGLGEPIAISAEHGEGIGELERDVLSALGLAQVPGNEHQEVDHAGDEGNHWVPAALHATAPYAWPSSAARTQVNQLSSTRFLKRTE